MNQTHDQAAIDYWHTQILDFEPATQGGKDVFRGSCPECSLPKKFDVYKTMPMSGKCIACGHKVSSVFDLGYHTDQERKEQTPVEKIVWRWGKNNPEKAYRLSQKIVDKLNLEIRTINSFKKDRTPQWKEWESLCFIGTDNKPIKWLNPAVGGGWLAVPGYDDKNGNNQRSADKWLNIANVKKQGPMKGTVHEDRIYINAGESDLTAFVMNMGIHSTSPAFGEGPQGDDSDPEDFDIYSNKHVLSMYDNDKIGRLGSSWLANKLTFSQNTKSIKSMDWSQFGMKGGEDTDDYYHKYQGTNDRLLDVINSAHDYVAVKLAVGGLSALDARCIPTPEYTAKTLSRDALDYVWKIGILPPAKRRGLWQELLKHENIDVDGEKNQDFVKNRLSDYNSEFHTMTTMAYDILIRKKLNELHVKKRKKYTEREKSEYYYYADGFYKLISDEMFKKISDDVARQLVQPDKRELLSKGRKQVLEDIENKILDAIETEFDTDASMINFLNGMYCLNKKKMLDHSFNYHTTSQLDISYKSDGDCPNFKDALLLWFEDDDTRKEFLKSLYYLITGDRSHDKAIFFFGKGSDGKGQASQLCSALVGEHLTSGIALEEISNNHMTAGLIGKQLNISDESKAKGHVSDAIFKRLTGNSITSANPKNRDVITFISKALWVVISNHLPSSSDNSHGYNRRWKLINFRRIPEDRKKTGFFKDHLRPELAGIVHYILTQGREIWEKANPEEIKDAKGNVISIKYTPGFTDSVLEEKAKAKMENKHSVNGYWDIILEEHSAAINDAVENGGSSPAQAAQNMVLDYTKMNDSIKSFYIFETRYKQDEKKVKVKWLAIDTRRHYEQYKKHTESAGQNPQNEINFRDSTENFMEKHMPTICKKGFDTRPSRNCNGKQDKILEVKGVTIE